MDLHIPDKVPERGALSRTTHLAIGAHADDLEVMAYHGIAASYDSPENWFGGIVVTDGAGSSRSGAYAGLSNDQMIQMRLQEQRNAANLGHYSFVAQLGFPSFSLDTQSSPISHQIADIIQQCHPSTIYLHNPADKHPTHISVLKSSLEALRLLPPASRPQQLYGCEVWRDLDWLADNSKVALDCSAYPELALSLIQVFDSQISGGKRYDLAALGRRHANATFSNPRIGDTMDCVTWALDLMPLLENPSLTLEQFMAPHLERFRLDVLKNLS